MELEYKSMPFAVKAISDRSVVGLQAVVGNVDSGGDRIMPGAFLKTIGENGARVKYLWMHNPFEPPVAKITNMREVGIADLPEQMRAKFPDAVGGLEVTREYLTHERADAIFEGIKAGAIDESSIGYDPIKFDYEQTPTNGQVRNLREVRLWDVSDVTWGMNPATMNLKHMGEEASLSALAYFSHALKEGRVIRGELMNRLRKAIEELNAVIGAAEPTDAGKASVSLTELRLRQDLLQRMTSI